MNNLKKKFLYLIISSRPQHSIKNVLIFLPILASNNLYNIHLLDTFFAFLFLNLITSGSYILNDIIDLKHDSLHLTKKFRPIASKKLSIIEALIFSFVLIFISIIFAIYLFSYSVVIYFIIYILITLIYSLYLKKIIILDLFVLSFLFVIRIYLGNLVSRLEESFWLLTFCFIFFLMLAAVKRMSELTIDSKTSGRGYKIYHTHYLKTLSYVLAAITLLIWIFYSFSHSANILYNSNELLILVGFIIFYWSLRIIKLSLNKQVGYDPVVFVLKDKTSYIFLLFMFIIIIFSKILGI